MMVVLNVLFWFCMTNIFLGILEAFMKSIVYWQVHSPASNILCENYFTFVFARLLYTLEFCRCRDESVYVNVGVVGNVLLGVFEGSIHPLSWTSWHRTLCTMQCWAFNVVANCKTAPQDIRWDCWPLDIADHFLWWHVTLTFSHKITTCAEKPWSGKFSRMMIINQVLTWTLSHKF